MSNQILTKNFKMKSKFNFFGVCVLTCALVLSLFSCTKDLQDQIDKLTTDVAALQSAINSGKLVKSVNPVAGGYDIVFSDNSTIRINHGTNGTNGTPGTPGAAGFTPIIGIDASGYWTVVASQGATPVRIKNASGNEVKASMSDNLTLVDNYLAVNGVKTTIYIPNIAYNATSRTLMIWAKNEDGTSTMYNVPLANEIVLTTDIIGLVSPIGNTKVLIQYGSVPTTGNNATALAWAGVTAGQSLGSDGVLPLIVNPSAAAVAGYTFEIIKADGTPFALQGIIEQGFDITKKFEQYTNPAAGGSNALYSIKLNPSLAEINAHMGTSLDKETKELAVRATKGTREIVSGYQYTIRVKKATEQLVEPAAGVVKYVPTGTSVDVMTMFSQDLALTIPQSASNFYKVGLAYSTTTPTNEDIKPYLSFTNASSVITSAKGNHTVANLNGRPAFLTLMSYDFIGSYKTRAAELRYFTDLSASVPDAALVSHTLTASASPADQKVISLDPMFTALDAEGKTELWRNNANNVKLTIRTSTGTYINVVPATVGISYEFLDLNNAVTALPTAMRKIRFTFDETIALPGNYTFRFEFGDAREGVAYPGGYPVADANTFKEFTFLIPVTVSNPASLPANSASLMIHTAGLWTGNDLSVFGPAGGQKLNPTAYDLAGAYSASLGAEPQANWAFMTTSTADNTAGLITGFRNYLVQRQTNPPTANPYTTLYTPKQVKLRYFWFGNANNYVDLETITVTAKSEIKEGALVNVLNTQANGTFVGEAGTGTTHTALTVVHGVTGTAGNPAKALKDYYRFNNYFGTDLKVFNIPIPATTSLVVEVKLELDAQYDNLLIIDPATMTVASKVSPLAPITGDVVVPVKVRVKDVFGLWFEGTVNVTVKKP